MKARLIGILLVVVIVGLLLVGGWWGMHSRTHFPSPALWRFLWPSIVALGLLALATIFFLTSGRRWIWPFLAGFLVQTIGIVLLAVGTFRKPGETLTPTTLAVGFVLFLILMIWLIATLRSRWLEQRMLAGVGGDVGVDQQKLGEIRKNMSEALAMLKKAGRGRNAIYELPWFLVIGRPAAGKTVAIKNSGLGLPVRKDWVKGVGGTHTCDWFFTNELIFLDTPGKWVVEGTGEEGKKSWTELLRLLRKYRGRRPLDGLVVVVPADDLLSRSDEELQELASNTREVIDLLHDELHFRFPVYLLVSKCDLVEGFLDFFRGLPPQRRHEILGWSHGDPNRGDPGRLIPGGFQRVLARLAAYRLEMLAKEPRTSRARRLFFFTEEFKRLERPLAVFADVLFQRDPYHQPPVFRGFYFTSGTQGEGSPIGQAMANLARSLGVRLGALRAEGEEEPKRSYFLLETFRELMVKDEALVSRTAREWFRRRRDTMLAAFLPALAAVLFLFFTLVSFVWNHHLYATIQENVPPVVQQIREARAKDASVGGVGRTLELTSRLEDAHWRLIRFNPLRGFGMRRPGDLKYRTFDVFRKQFRESVLGPMLRRAEDIVADPDSGCAERAKVFYSVVWLGLGKSAESNEDLSGVDEVLGLSGDKADASRDLLLDQFSYYRKNRLTDEPLLPGMSLERAAKSIKDHCNFQGAIASLNQYQSFESQCADSIGACEVTGCYTRLKKVLDFDRDDLGRMQEHLQDLKDDLGELSGRNEPGAREALDLIKDLGWTSAKGDRCTQEFSSDVVPTLVKYAHEQARLGDDCNSHGAGGRLEAVTKVYVDQKKDLEALEKELGKRVDRFNDDCSASRLNSQKLIDMLDLYRKYVCMGEDKACRGGAAPARPATSRSSVPSSTGGSAPISRASTSLLSVGVPIAGIYTADGWKIKRDEFNEKLQLAGTFSSPEKESRVKDVETLAGAYGSDYYNSWMKYLSNLRVQPPREPIPSWIEHLHTTTEFEQVLKPVADASQLTGAEGEHFLSLGQKVGALSKMNDFLRGPLAEYQSLLGKVAADLTRCKEDPSFGNQYRGEVSSGSSSNSLVRTSDWVDSNARNAFDGAMRSLFSSPVEEAKNFLQSRDLGAAQWGQMRKLYDKVSDKYPFAKDGSELPSSLDLVGLLGGETGAVPLIEKGSRGYGSRAQSWLAKAGPVAESLFREGKNDLRPLHINLTVLDPTFDPPDAKDAFRVDSIDVNFGEGNELDSPKAGKKKTFDLDLFGDRASKEASVEVTVAERKGFVGRTFGKDFKEPHPFIVHPETGLWAPLKLIQAGLPQGAGAAGTSLDLVYEVNLTPGEKKPKMMKVLLKAEGDALPHLLRLMSEGLAAPPAGTAD